MSSLHTLTGLCYSVTALFTCQDTGNADPFGSLLSIGLDGVCILEIQLAANVHVAVERLMKLVSQLTWKVRRWNVAYHIHITLLFSRLLRQEVEEEVGSIITGHILSNRWPQLELCFFRIPWDISSCVCNNQNWLFVREVGPTGVCGDISSCLSGDQTGCFFENRHVVDLFVATKAGILSPSMSTVLWEDRNRRLDPNKRKVAS